MTLFLFPENVIVFRKPSAFCGKVDQRQRKQEDTNTIYNCVLLMCLMPENEENSVNVNGRVGG